MGGEDKDHYIRNVARRAGYSSHAALCSAVLGDRAGGWKQYQHLGHMIPIWEPQVAAEVNKILGITSGYAGPDGREEANPAEDVALGSRAAEVFQGRYHTLPKHKVFAIGPQGTYGYSQWNTSAKDAQHDALYYCNEYLHNRLSLRDRRCTIYAVDDQVVFRSAGR
jgi:hypothetical protein